MREAIAVRVEEESESAVLSRDELDALSVPRELEHAVPVMEIVDPLFSGDEGVRHGD